MQAAKAEAEQGELASRGHTETLAAMDNLKASYDVGLERMRDCHRADVQALQGRLDVACEEGAALRRELNDARLELRVLSVRCSIICGGGDRFVHVLLIIFCVLLYRYFVLRTGVFEMLLWMCCYSGHSLFDVCEAAMNELRRYD
jgi:hypothetical protein